MGDGRRNTPRPASQNSSGQRAAQPRTGHDGGATYTPQRRPLPRRRQFAAQARHAW
jgi:hypothetical protein